MTNQHGTLNVVVSRDRSANAGRTTLENAVAALFAERAGATVLVVPHLYHVPEDDPVWKKLAGLTGRVVFLSWLYPRPAEWLLRRHGVGAEGLLALHMGAYETAEQCFEAAAANLAAAPGTVTELSGKPSKRWYPVLDYSRCAKCRQCLQFCLFGVYAADEECGVRVVNPDNCRPGCPACSRICPRGAIMFPLYDKDEAIAGAPGKFVSPDENAKAMFEKRTKRTYRQLEPAADDGLDALIDDLDRLTRGRP